MRAELRVAGPGRDPSLRVDGLARSFPVVGLYEAVCWALTTFPACRSLHGALTPGELAGRPELLNQVGIDSREPGGLLFFVAKSPFRFYLYGLSLHTGPSAILKAVVEGVAHTWSTLLLEEVIVESEGGAGPGWGPRAGLEARGELHGSGWPFRVEPFCRFLAGSSGMTVLASAAACSPGRSAPLFQETRARHARLCGEMAGCFSVLADI